ncbi:MAG: efflux RND transporter periplasmic adaptor subunit, partial [Verrucomicrobiales bacterium]|nr:efflux RND transporter periplasmic adaptor subunit [Verrucomicrobiales bacterium]
KFGGILLRLWKRATRNQRTILCIAAFIAGGMMFAPVSMPVKATCTLQPEVRRTVSAPFDGILRRAFVDPGERVSVGQPLAELDGREVDWNLADTEARILGAGKQADLALSAGQIADSQIANLEAESLSETIKVLKYRKENLVIKSPISGLILEGDLKRDVGATMRMGEALFEVGSVDTMVAEIEVDESDISLIRQSAEVRLRFDSKPGEALEGEIISVSPQSEFRSGANVFICRVVLENQEGWLWPGGMGRARIDGPRRPAIWCLLRTPANWILQHLP